MNTATITVELHRGTIDPQDIGSDDDLRSCAEFVLDAVRKQFPGADVRSVGTGGRTTGTWADGDDATDEVKTVVAMAFDAWCAG